LNLNALGAELRKNHSAAGDAAQLYARAGHELFRLHPLDRRRPRRLPEVLDHRGVEFLLEPRRHFAQLPCPCLLELLAEFMIADRIEHLPHLFAVLAQDCLQRPLQLAELLLLVLHPLALERDALGAQPLELPAHLPLQPLQLLLRLVERPD